MWQIDLDAPIIPAEGLGGLAVRTPLGDIQSLVKGLGLYKPGHYKLVSPFEAHYVLESGGVSVCVDVRNGRVFKLIAGEGYRGRLMDCISVGMNAGAVMAMDPRITYDEMDEGLTISGVPGVFIEVDDDDSPPEIVPGLPIVAISVYAPEALKPDGHKGLW